MNKKTEKYLEQVYTKGYFQGSTDTCASLIVMLKKEAEHTESLTIKEFIAICKDIYVETSKKAK